MGYRTSVLTDFSIVSKARFYILEKLSSESLAAIFLKAKYGAADIENNMLPVQVNPTDISLTYGKETGTAPKFGGINYTRTSYDSPPMKKVSEGSAAHGSLSINLRYDIYDEYMVRTMEGLIPSDMSLQSETATSLCKLARLAGDTRYHVLFVWGDWAYFGQLINTRVDYTVFSRWGAPLKGTAVIEITRVPLDGRNKEGLEIPPLENSDIDWTFTLGVQADILISNTLNRAALAVTQALR